MKRNIVLIGLTGCGKTTVGARLSKELNMPFIDVDEMIEERYGSIKDLFAVGESYFRDIESQAVSEVAQLEGVVVSTGGGVVLRPANMEALKAKGLIFYLKRPVEEILKTIDPSNRPLLKNGNEVLYKLSEEREPLYLKYCDSVILSSDIEPAIDAIKGQWKKNGL